MRFVDRSASDLDKVPFERTRQASAFVGSLQRGSDAVIGETFDVDRFGDSVIVTLSGDLDHGNEAAVHDLINRQLRRHDDVYLECSRVAFMDAGGLNVLIEAVAKASGRVTVINASPAVHRVLRLIAIPGLVMVDGSTPLNHDHDHGLPA
jgi:anti-anti-sigma factor